MERPITSLWWSGVAAGLSISFSLLVLPARTGDSPGAFARHLMAAAAHQPWVPGRIFDRRPGMPTALYGKHHHSGTAPRRQFHGGQFGEAGSVVDNRLRRQYDRDSRSRSVLYVAAGSCPRAARRNDRHQPTYPPDELDRVFLSGDFRRLLDRRNGVADPERRGRRLSRNCDDDLPDRNRRFPAHLLPAASKPFCWLPTGSSGWGI